MENFSPRQSLNLLKTIHVALMTTPLFVGAMALLIGGGDASAEGLEVLLYLPWGILLVAVGTTPLVFKLLLSKAIGEGKSLHAKLGAYTSAHIVRMAMFEAPALLAGVVAFITGDQVVLGVVAVVAAIFILKTPTAFKIVAEMELSQIERNLLEH